MLTLFLFKKGESNPVTWAALSVFFAATAWVLCLVMGRPEVDASNLAGRAAAPGFCLKGWDAALKGGRRDLAAGWANVVLRSQTMFDGTSDGVGPAGKAGPSRYSLFCAAIVLPSTRSAVTLKILQVVIGVEVIEMAALKSRDSSKLNVFSLLFSVSMF